MLVDFEEEKIEEVKLLPLINGGQYTIKYCDLSTLVYINFHRCGYAWDLRYLPNLKVIYMHDLHLLPPSVINVKIKRRMVINENFRRNLVTLDKLQLFCALSGGFVNYLCLSVKWLEIAYFYGSLKKFDLQVLKAKKCVITEFPETIRIITCDKPWKRFPKQVESLTIGEITGPLDLSYCEQLEDLEIRRSPQNCKITLYNNEVVI